MIHSLAPPKDIAENRLYRAWLLQACDTPGRQSAVMERSKDDISFWINSFAFQYNPKPVGSWTPEVGPFVTWEFQDRAIAKIRYCIDSRKDIAIEKSRDMGISWLCLLIFDHSFLFESWKKFLVISRNEMAVDRAGDSDCLFWKLDYVHDRLPDWMVRCDRTKMRRKMGFRHPLTHSAITGQASTGKAGVGGRCTAMFIDEFGQIDEDYEVLQRTSDTTDCRIFNSTHTSEGLAFAEITDPSTAAGSFIQKLQMHWTEHPDKQRGLYRYDAVRDEVTVLDKHYEYPDDFKFVRSELPAGGPFPGRRSPYYDDQCKRKGNTRAVALDLDIDRGGGSSKFFDPIRIRALRENVCCNPVWEGDLQYDRDSGRPLKLVAAVDGPLKLWVRPKSDHAVPAGRYGAGCDLATGTGASNSVCSIGDSKTGLKVMEYATPHVPPEQFAPLVTALCWLFSSEDGEPTLLAWEDAGPGLMFGKTVILLGYRRVFYRESAQMFKAVVKSDVPGWHPTPNTKRILLESYRAALYEKDFINRSDMAMQECGPYRYSAKKDNTIEHPHDAGGDDPTGARSNHGDRVIGDALCWLALQKLGAGKPESQKVEEEVPELQSFLWRRMKREQQKREAEAWI